MKIGYKPELYKETVDILYNAYFNDTLRHENCYACAIGNIIAYRNGYKVKGTVWETPTNPYIMPLWGKVFMTCRTADIAIPHFNLSSYKEATKQEIDSIGYPIGESARIERAFEMADVGECDEDYMFNGLVAVIKVLNDIHEVTEDKETIPKFKNHRLTLIK